MLYAKSNEQKNELFIKLVQLEKDINDRNKYWKENLTIFINSKIISFSMKKLAILYAADEYLLESTSKTLELLFGQVLTTYYRI